jgi:photosystem II stability/assembly factor-like uncharacterized protein
MGAHHQRTGRRRVVACLVLAAAAVAPALTALAPDAGAARPSSVTVASGGWSRSAPPAGLRGAALHGLACAGQDCLAIGASCPGGSCPGVAPQVAVATRDLGRTWSRTTVPTGFEFAFEGVSCPSASFCFVGGTRAPGTPSPRSGLAITHDLGAHWATHTVTGLGHLITATCPSVSICFAVGYSNPPVSEVAFGQVAYSRDGGLTWATALFPLTGFMDGITCSTPSVCTAFGTSQDGGHTVLVQTTNAGATWSQRSLPMRLGTLRWLTCPTRHECVAVSNRPLGRPGSVDVSHDGGATWATHSIGLVNVLYDAACATAQACGFVGQGLHGRPLLDVTSDGGAHWSLRLVASVAAGRLWSLSCSRLGHCVAVGEWWSHTAGDGGPLLLRD